MHEYDLGQEVEDSVTGFSGIITAKLESLHEEPLFAVENETNSRWLPIARLTAKVTA